MEGQKKTNWADESDEEWSDNEVPVAPLPQSSKAYFVPNDHKELMISQVKKSNFPLVLSLGNLAYSLREPVLIRELGISDKSTLNFIREESRFTGSATVCLGSVEDALLVVQKIDANIAGRPLLVRFDKEREFYERPHRGGRGARIGKPRGRHSQYGDRYERKERNHEGNYSRNYEKYTEKQYEKYSEKKSEKYTEKKSEKYTEKKIEKYNEKKIENNRVTNNQTGKITIANAEANIEPTQTTPGPPKAKSNPFGQAKPVDTLKSDLEFLKALEEKQKKSECQSFEHPKEERKYKVKDPEKKSEVNETKRKNENEIEKIDQGGEKKSLGDESISEAKEAENEKNSEIRPEHSDERSGYGYRGRGGKRRDNKYRVKYPQEGREGGETRVNHEDKGRPDINNQNHPSTKEDSERNQENLQKPFQVPIEKNQNPTQKSSETKEDSQRLKQRKEQKESEESLLETNKSSKWDTNDQNAYHKNHNPSDRKKPSGNSSKKYNEKRQYKPKKNYDEPKKSEEAKIIPEKPEEIKPAKKPVKAWGNPDEAAEILKKPKEPQPLEKTNPMSTSSKKPH